MILPARTGLNVENLRERTICEPLNSEEAFNDIIPTLELVPAPCRQMNFILVCIEL